MNRFNIILPSTCTSSNYSLLFLTSPTCDKCPAHFILLESVILITFVEDYKLWSTSRCNFLQPPVNFSLSVQMFSSADLTFGYINFLLKFPIWNIYLDHYTSIGEPRVSDINHGVPPYITLSIPHSSYIWLHVSFSSKSDKNLWTSGIMRCVLCDSTKHRYW
jgi:hypothetical protein